MIKLIMGDVFDLLREPAINWLARTNELETVLEVEVGGIIRHFHLLRRSRRLDAQTCLYNLEICELLPNETKYLMPLSIYDDGWMSELK
jgi:hypothetical protein